MSRQLITITIAMLIAAVTVLADAEETRLRESSDETITYLLDFVAKSNCAFIRNGESYSGKQASSHMKNKYSYYKDQIKTPEDFIRLAATKSILSGKPYMVRTKDGAELRCDEWMAKVLGDYRKNRG